MPVLSGHCDDLLSSLLTLTGRARPVDPSGLDLFVLDYPEVLYHVNRVVFPGNNDNNTNEDKITRNNCIGV